LVFEGGAVVHVAGRGADRLTAEGGDALCDLIGVTADEVDLGGDDLVDGDEVRADNVPVDALDDEVAIVVIGETLLQSINKLLGVGVIDSWDCVVTHDAHYTKNLSIVTES